MIRFDKLVIISGNKYSIRTDEISDIGTLFMKLTDVNTFLILIIRHGSDIHTLDLGRLILNNVYLLESANIHDLVNQLTPLMIYTYRTEIFKQNKIVRSFMSHDLPNPVVVSACNITTGETTNTTYNHNYQDMVIQSEEFNLNNVFPIIHGKIRDCEWYNEKIYIRNGVELVKSTAEITFISFGNITLQKRKLKDIIQDEYDIQEGKVIMLVLCGKLFYDNPHIFMVDKVRNKLVLNSVFIMDIFSREGYSNFDKVINDLNSFVLYIESDCLFIRDVLMVPVREEENVLQFVYHEDDNQFNHVDYICMNKLNHSIHGLTTVDEKYMNVIKMTKPNEHHVYVSNGDNNMKLIQLAIC